ncbi:MAG: hypothetical protein JW910_04830, partial [Anaerolineae bacterium]|nr:hypothetical protein [Anaerolineae bacterium]
MLRKFSLQTQLIIFIVLALVLLTIGLQVVQTVQTRAALVHAERQRSLALTSSVSATIQAVSPLIATLEDISELDARLVQLVRQSQDIDFITVTWPDGEVIFHSDEAYKGRVVGDLAELPADETVRRTVEGYGAVYLTSLLLDNPVTAGPDQFYITVGSSVDPIDSSLLGSILLSGVTALG